MKSVAVLGANHGNIGGPTAEILRGHPYVNEVLTPSREELPEFEGADVVFSALPHGISSEYVQRFANLGSTVIDFSGDLRFQTAEEYERAYSRPHPAPDLLPVTYGLPEHSRKQLHEKKIAAIPGCYPTGTILALKPPVDAGLIRQGSGIIVDADSAASGASSKPSELTHFMNIAGNVIPYSTGDEHRHVAEIEQFMNDRSVFFSPAILSLEEGMFIRATVTPADGVTPEKVLDVLHAAYDDEPFVHIKDLRDLPEGEEKLPEVKDTARTDECHIGIAANSQFVQFGVTLGNRRKGGSSQGVHVWNIMEGYEETAGLTPKASMR